MIASGISNEPNSLFKFRRNVFYGEGVFEDLNKSKELFNKACKIQFRSQKYK